MAKLKKETVESIKRNPIYTKDKGKVKAYADSLSTYNKGEKRYNDYKKFADENNLKFIKQNNTWTDSDGKVYNYEYFPFDEINKKLAPKDIYTFLWKGAEYERGKRIKIGGAVDKNDNEVNEDLTKKLYLFTSNYSNSEFGYNKAPRYNKPAQPYLLKEDEIINKVSPIGQKEIEIENEELSPVELKNKKVSVKEPEHFLDISEPDGKGTKRMYFESREELENFQKENPMLKTGSFSRAKIKPEVLEILKKKK
jgi:hypothetical protein